MKEIDTESPVVWPAWCYSGNLSTDNIKQSSATSAALAAAAVTVPSVGVKILSRQAAATTTTATLSTFLTSLSSSAASSVSSSSSSTSSSSSSSASSTASSCSTEIAGNNIADFVTNKSPTIRKTNFTTPALRQSAAATAAEGVVGDITDTSNKIHTTTIRHHSPYKYKKQRRSNKNNNNSDNNNISCSSKTASTSVSAVRKMLSERSLLLSGFNAIESAKRLCDSTSAAAAAAATTTTAAPNATAAAAALLYLEKVKNEKLSPRVTVAQIDSLKDAIMESTAIGNSTNNNNNNNNSLINNSNNIRLQNAVAVSNSIFNDHHHHQQQQHQQALGSSTVKRERLSPGTNGELQTTLSRSRSATPSSFRGTPPHAALQNTPPESLMPVHNLLTSIQQQVASAGRHATAPSPNTLPTDFSTRNYSEFMRSLAAKYNNSNPNDSSSSRRGPFFDSTSTASSAATALSNSKASTLNKPPPSILVSKDPKPPPLLSPPDAANNLKSQNAAQTHLAAAAAAASAAAANSSSLSPFMTSLLSSLPFSQGFPPLIDMSSTQALVTLARAAKEAEIQNILRSAQHPKRSNSSASSSPRCASITAALQQAAQFVAPTLFYSTQMQHQQSRQSSPLQTPRSTSGGPALCNEKTTSATASSAPLDLSSQPPAAKRFKAESTSSQGSGSDVLSMQSPLPLSSPGIETTTTSSVTANVEAAPTIAKSRSSGSMQTTIPSSSAQRQCQAQSDEVNAWSVYDVCAFVGGIDICAEYVQNFRDQCIDGSGLPLLTEDHLMNSLGMKLGPALKLRSMLVKKLGGPCPCVSCVAQAQILAAQTLQTGSVAVAAATASVATTAAVTAATSSAATVTAGSATGNSPHGQQTQQQQQHQRTSTATTATSGGSSSTSSSTCNSNINSNNNSSENSSNNNNSTNVVNNSIANNDCSSSAGGGSGSSNNNNNGMQRPGSADSSS